MSAPEDLNHGKCCKSQLVTRAMSHLTYARSLFSCSDSGDEAYATSVLNHSLNLESPPIICAPLLGSNLLAIVTN